MPKYLVELSADYHNKVEVEADGKKEAEELACEKVANEVLKSLFAENIEEIKEDQTEFFIGDKVYPTDANELHDLVHSVNNGLISLKDFYGIITEKDKIDNAYVVTWINGKTKEEEVYSDIKNAWWNADGLTCDYNEFIEAYETAFQWFVNCFE